MIDRQAGRLAGWSGGRLNTATCGPSACRSSTWMAQSSCLYRSRPTVAATSLWSGPKKTWNMQMDSIVICGLWPLPTFAAHGCYLDGWEHMRSGMGTGLRDAQHMPGAAHLGVQSLPQWVWNNSPVFPFRDPLFLNSRGSHICSLSESLRLHVHSVNLHFWSKVLLSDVSLGLNSGMKNFSTLVIPPSSSTCLAVLLFSQSYSEPWIGSFYKYCYKLIVLKENISDVMHWWNWTWYMNLFFPVYPIVYN